MLLSSIYRWRRFVVCLFVIAMVVQFAQMLFAANYSIDVENEIEKAGMPQIKLISPEQKETRTSKSEVLIKGVVQNCEKLYLNGKPLTFTSTGRFYTILPLPDTGEYEIWLRAVNDRELASEIKAKVVRISSETPLPDVSITRPLINLLEPANDFRTWKDKVFVKGNVTNTLILKINDQDVPLDNNGKFSTSIQLPTIGENSLLLVAYGKDNLKSTLERKVTRALSSARVADQKQLITLNLVETDIQDVIPVLTKQTGLNFIGDKSLSGKVTIYLKDVELYEALDLILRANGYDFQKIGTTIFVAPPARLATLKTTQIQIFKLKNIQASNAAIILNRFLQENNGESIEVSNDENMLVIKAMSDTMTRIEKVIEEIDRNKPQQVVIEAKIAEITTDAMRRLGISWDLKGIATTLTMPLQKPIADATLENMTVAAGLDLLFENGDAKLLASPKLSAMNNKKATIMIGDRVPYVTTKTSSTGDTSTSVEYVEAGIKMEITPVINPVDQSITLTVYTEVSFIAGYVGPNNEIPQVRTRQADTTIRINNGETALIGGLINSQENITKTGIPFIGNIPVIGTLFSTDVNERTDSELIITITPRVVSID